MRGEEQESPQHTVTRKRARIMWVVSVVFLVACATQLFIIQIVRGPALAEQGRIVRTSASSIEAPRGKIVDANGDVLVDSVMTYHLAVNQKNLREYHHRDDDYTIIASGPEEAARQLAPLLGMDPIELGGKLVGDSTYEYIARNVEADTFREIRKLNIYGLEWEPVYERVYPGGDIALPVLGSVNADGEGAGGLELSFDELLQGTPGEVSSEIGPTGEIIPGAKVVSREALPGATIHTTIRTDLQHSIENALNEAVEKYQADWGAVVVIETKTSRVLALADSVKGTSSDAPISSRAVTTPYEPGSVGKVPTVVAALDKGTVTPTTVFEVPDTYMTDNGQTFTDFYNHETFSRTVNGILAESFNTGTVKIGQTLSDEDRYDMMQRLGFGKPTGIELPGESAGIFTDPSTWDGRTRYTNMFGQGYAITAIQQAAMVATVGNDGVWQSPRLVDGWTLPDGTYQPAETRPLVQAMQPETAHATVSMMESVVRGEGGTGGVSAVDGYRTAIKTGTAERADGGTVTTVAGLLPAENPQIAIAVVLDNPRAARNSYESAAPLFKQAATSAVRNLGIPASTEDPVLYPIGP